MHGPMASVFAKLKSAFRGRGGSRPRGTSSPKVSHGLSVHPDTNLEVKGTLIVGEQVSLGRFSSLIVPEDSTIVLGSRIWISDNCHIESVPGGSINIGSETSLQSRCQIRGEVIIGNKVLLAPNVFISSGSHMYDYVPELTIREQDQKYLEDKGRSYSSPIQVGDDCWLGINVVVMPGVSIGSRCVIGANAVVTEDIPTDTVAGGIPAKVIRSRKAASSAV